MNKSQLLTYGLVLVILAPIGYVLNLFFGFGAALVFVVVGLGAAIGTQMLFGEGGSTTTKRSSNRHSKGARQQED